jgi:hypothetical protein
MRVAVLVPLRVRAGIEQFCAFSLDGFAQASADNLLASEFHLRTSRAGTRACSIMCWRSDSATRIDLEIL